MKFRMHSPYCKAVIPFFPQALSWIFGYKWIRYVRPERLLKPGEALYACENFLNADRRRVPCPGSDAAPSMVQFATRVVRMKTKDLVCVVDDDEGMRNAISRLLRSIAVEVRTYASPTEFLHDPLRHECKCLVLDVRMPEMSGPKLQSHLVQSGCTIPVIFITGYVDVQTVVETMRLGAVDFLEKPFSEQKLLDCVQGVLARQLEMQQESVLHSQIEARLSLLTPREQQVMTMLVDGHSSKVIAEKLTISTRTVEDHRASILKKLRVPSVVVLIGVLSKVRHA